MTADLKLHEREVSEGEELIAFLSYLTIYDLELVRQSSGLGKAILLLAAKFIEKYITNNEKLHLIKIQ